VVILEEIGPNDCDWIAPMLKIWADRFPFIAEMKGRSRMIRPKKVVVTSNYSPSAIFLRDEDLDAIRRRFKVDHMLGFIGVYMPDPMPELTRQDAIIN